MQQQPQNLDFQKEGTGNIKGVFMTSNSVALSGIMYLLFSFLVAVLVRAVVHAFTGTGSILSENAGDLLINLHYLLGTLIPLPLAFIIFAKMEGMKVSESLPLSFNLKKVTLGISCSFLAMIISRIIVVLVFILLSGADIYQYDAPVITVANGLGGKVVVAVVVTLMTGLLEEFAFRGIILTKLRKYGDVFAIVTSSAFFGLMHRNWIQGVNAFAIGLIFAYAVIATGSLWTSIILHTLNNLQAISVLIFPQDAAIIINLVLTLIMAVLGVSAAVIVIVYRKQVKKHIQLNKETAGSWLSKTMCFAFSPVMIGLIVVIGYYDRISDYLYDLIKIIAG